MPDYVDLALPRTVVIRQGANQFIFEIPPVTEKEWLKYFDGIVSTAERSGAEILQNIDASTAGVELVNSLLSRQGRDPAAIPLAHRLAIANVLASAYAPDTDVTPMETSHVGERVRLYAIWTGSKEGTMRRFKNLVHYFETPTAEQNRRYRRDDTRAQVVAGSRKGMTVYHGAQRTLAALYDELVVGVAGYAANGVALEGREQIAEHMDTYHKVAAAVQLFAPAEMVIEDEEESE